ncbi:hypothetical protein PS2_000067 [Malus domestica]
MKDWALVLVKQLLAPKFDLFMMLYWAIWGERNSRLWNNMFEVPNIFVSRVTSLWHEFISTNSNGALIKDLMMGGIGIVVRDCHGNFVAGVGRNFDFVPFSFHAEVFSS